MNKNDFEILSPTSKQKTEMKERLMLEAEFLSTVQNSTGRVISVDADELIEAKPRTKKSDFVMKFATIAAAVAFVAVVSGFFIMNNNGVQTLASQESAGETVASEVSSDKPSESASSHISSVTENETENPIAFKGKQGPLEPYISDIGSFNRTAVLPEVYWAESLEEIRIELQGLYYTDDKIEAKYKITNLSDNAMDIDVALNSEDKNYFNVCINGYSYRSRFTPYGHLTAEFSKKSLLKEESAEVLISVDYDTLLSLGIDVVKNFGVTFYFGERFPGDEVSFKNFNSVFLAVDMHYENHKENETSYEKQLTNGVVQKKMGYTLLNYVDNLNYEYDGSIKIESAALLKTHHETTGNDHYTIRLTVYNSATGSFRFNTVISKINDEYTMLAGDNLPGGVVHGKSRLILEVSTSNLDALKKNGIEEINKIQLTNIIDGMKETSHNVDIVFAED